MMRLKDKFLIVAGGQAPSERLLKAKAAESAFIIAADKGAQYCLEQGIIPDLVVGDMDSISPEFLKKMNRHKVEIKRFSPDKDKTDTQIAFEEAIGKGAALVDILAATGSRIDHSLANINLLYLALKAGVKAVIISDVHEIFLIKGKAAILGYTGKTVSFLPFGMKASGITLEGFAYEISDAVMEAGFPFGISNVIISDNVKIIVKKGLLLAVIVKKKL